MYQAKICKNCSTSTNWMFEILPLFRFQAWHNLPFWRSNAISYDRTRWFRLHLYNYQYQTSNYCLSLSKSYNQQMLERKEVNELSVSTGFGHSKMRSTFRFDKSYTWLSWNDSLPTGLLFNLGLSEENGGLGFAFVFFSYNWEKAEQTIVFRTFGFHCQRTRFFVYSSSIYIGRPLVQIPYNRSSKAFNCSLVRSY